MEKSKTYSKARFSAEVLQSAFDLFTHLIGEATKLDVDQMSIETGKEEWRHDNPSEFGPIIESIIGANST